MRPTLPFAAALAAMLLAVPAAQAAPVTTDFTTAGESVFNVPAGVHSVDVELTGARGGLRSGLTTAGRGATVSGKLAVTPGSKLYAEVGGPGTDHIVQIGSWTYPGGSNGGGSGSSGGGGASDIRTAAAGAPGSLLTRLAVAGGGGGAGYPVTGQPDGGDAGARGRDSSNGQAGGHTGTQARGGNGGTAPMWGVGGNAGLLGFGGSAPVAAFVGGGGGGGYYGGGSGAGMGACNPCNVNGGGGGGSSLVPAGGTSGHAALTDAARVRITYQSAKVAANASDLAFPATQPGAISAARTVELTNTGTSTDVVFFGASLNSDAFIIGDASNCTGALAPGAKCAISVRFAPAAAGAHSAKLKIESNADPLEIALGGEGSSPAQPLAGPVAGGANGTAGGAGSNGTNGARGTVSKAARVTCKRKRCSVEFLAGVPKVSANGTRVQATLTRGGRVYATVDRTARKGNLRLVLNAQRTVKPGAYTLVLKIGKTRTTRTATVA